MRKRISAIEPVLVANLLLLARAYAKWADVKLSSVSRSAHGDSRSFDHLADGSGSISLRKYDSSMAWFVENWPTDLPWPDLQIPAFRKRRRPPA